MGREWLQGEEIEGEKLDVRVLKRHCVVVRILHLLQLSLFLFLFFITQTTSPHFLLISEFGY